VTGGTLALILISVTLSACAQVLFKFGVSSVPGPVASGNPSLVGTVLGTLLRPGVLGGLALYGIGTLIWLRALAQVPLSQAYPFVGLGFVLTAALGFMLFNEALGPSRLIGTALVIAGVFLVGRS
jgi:multidrug transporter EmrE-like cation transporter